MKLILILLITVSILSLLSGIAVLSGVRKGERAEGFLYFFITFFAVFWAGSIGIFLSLPESTSPETAKICALFIYLPALFMSWGLASYQTFKYKIGKFIMIFYGLFCLVLFVLPLLDSSYLYSSIVLSETSGNIVNLKHNLYNILYMAYFITTCGVYMLAFLYKGRRAKNPSVKRASYITLIGFTITGVVALVFDVVLSFMGKYDTIWAGPLAMCFAWILHYYAIIKYRLLDLSGSWLKALSYVIVMSLVAIVYLIIFFVIFTGLFRVSNPSLEVILLNSIMIIIVLLLFPALNELTSYFRSLSSISEVDLVYLVKKLVLLSKSYINYFELSDFLAEHLHFQYIGILYSGKLYGSGNHNNKLSAEELKKIEKLKNKDKDIWLPFDDALKTELKSLGVEAIAELRNARGEVVGKILLGRPLGGINLSSRDLGELETALTLTAAAISSEKSLK
ncbi:hypothetical protein IJH66_00890 [Candidatus Saccharibacteria bacterium]|nr:hypothetical protein [Candidatus Saccharibacteria bacterium]